MQIHDDVRSNLALIVTMTTQLALLIYVVFFGQSKVANNTNKISKINNLKCSTY